MQFFFFNFINYFTQLANKFASKIEGSPPFHLMNHKCYLFIKIPQKCHQSLPQTKLAALNITIPFRIIMSASQVAFIALSAVQSTTV